MHFLITGGSGFIGQHLARRLAAEGSPVTALVRRTSATAELERAGARLAAGDLNTGEGLAEALEGIDCVIHLAGVTKARTEEEYHRCNAQGTRRLVEAIAARGGQPPRLVYCSSIAAGGPSLAGRPRREDEVPAPVSIYGRSKLGGEEAVRELSCRVPSVIVRPPIVYGPADKEFLPSFIPMLRLGMVLKSGFGRKLYSLIHVADLCEGLLLAALRGKPLQANDAGAGVYYLSDGHAYTWEDVCAALAQALGKSSARIIPIPEALSYAVGWCSELQARVRGTVPMLSVDKVREMRCADWTCSTERARDELSFRPAYNLLVGFQHSIEWYRKEGLL